MSGIFLLLGSNMGDRLSHLQKACDLLVSSDVQILRASSIYETAPWGKTDQQWFLNVVVEVQSSLPPEALLTLCLQVETDMGRIRSEKWAERLIDIDILYFDKEVTSSDVLEIPHPGIPSRKFTLMPLVELAADFSHPTLGKTQQQLLENVDDPLEVLHTKHTLTL